MSIYLLMVSRVQRGSLAHLKFTYINHNYIHSRSKVYYICIYAMSVQYFFNEIKPACELTSSLMRQRPNKCKYTACYNFNFKSLIEYKREKYNYKNKKIHTNL